MKDRPHFQALDSLRGLFACLVVLHHMPSTGGFLNSAFVQNAWLAVDYFFVLSGFVIATSYGQRLASGYPLSQFIFLRFGRVYPVHLAVLLVFVALELLVLATTYDQPAARPAFSGTRSVEKLLASLSFTHPFLSGQSWNRVSWSVAVEFWTYVVFAAVALTARRHRTLAMGLIAAGCLGGLAITGDGALDRLADWTTMLRCLCGFGVGVVAYRLHERLEGRLPLSFGIATVVEVALIAATAAFMSLASGPITLVAPALFAAGVLLFARQRGGVSVLLTTRPMLFLGAISYSLYMVHWLVVVRSIDVLRIVQRRTGLQLSSNIEVNGMSIEAIDAHGLLGVLVPLAIFGAAVAAAWILYVLVERPGRRWSRLIVERRGGHSKRTVEAEQTAPTF